MKSEAEVAERKSNEGKPEFDGKFSKYGLASSY